MKKPILFLCCLAGAISLISCVKDEAQIIEELSFQVNGKSVSYSDPNAGLDIFDQLIVSGDTEGSNEAITIEFLNNTKGVFTQEDIDDTQSSLASNYNIVYYDQGDNFYNYSKLHTDANFAISVEEFSKDDGGLVKGTFSGILYGSILNGISAPDSVVISNGKFMVKRADASLDNIY